MHHLLTTAFYTRDHSLLSRSLHELEAFRKKHYEQFNQNSKILSFLYVHQGRLNRCFLEGDFKTGVKEILPKTLQRLNKYQGQLDLHKVMIFYYKIAWLHFGNQQPGEAIFYLKRIIDLRAGHLRDELHAYAHLLFLMAHYELGNIDLLDYLIASAGNFFEKLPSVTPLQRATLAFFRRVARLDFARARTVFVQFREELTVLSGSPFERRDFIFLDVPSWVESRLRQRPLTEIVQETFRCEASAKQAASS
jgi:hypothetical protein